jgi:hypothetical protein
MNREGAKDAKEEISREIGREMLKIYLFLWDIFSLSIPIFGVQQLLQLVDSLPIDKLTK